MQAPKLFHAAINELNETGFLSNRVRQIFASIWINDLKLPWMSGAKLFELNLIDYDVYSNYGNWMYLAGVGVDPRGKRYFNTDKQLAAYDPHGDYLKKWL
jgi:deoxyribodipyrimidine photo-lyase